MRELNKNYVYSLEDLTSEEKIELGNNVFNPQNIENVFKFPYIRYDKELKTWLATECVKPTHNAKELFYTLENIQVNCNGLTKKEIANISDIIYNKKGTRPILTINGYIIHKYQPKKTTITYEKFMELFGNKETLQEKEQRLLKELEEVRKEIEESKIKVGDWVVNTHHGSVFKNDTINLGINHPNRYKRITNQELIKLLENEIK